MTERELYQRVHLKPFADMHRLDLVEILISGSGSSGNGVRAEVVP